MIDPRITQELLHKRFDYNPETGVMTYRVASKLHKAGDPVGCLVGKGYKTGKGYLAIRIFDKMTSVAKLIWLYVYGSWPTLSIDHINRIPSDNRLCNLREADRFQQIQNQRKAKISKSGHVGVYWHKKTRAWTAEITAHGTCHCLGYFHTLEEAVAVRKAAEQKYFGEFAPV